MNNGLIKQAGIASVLRRLSRRAAVNNNWVAQFAHSDKMLRPRRRMDRLFELLAKPSKGRISPRDLERLATAATDAASYVPKHANWLELVNIAKDIMSKRPDIDPKALRELGKRIASRGHRWSPHDPIIRVMGKLKRNFGKGSVSRAKRISNAAINRLIEKGRLSTTTQQHLNAIQAGGVDAASLVRLARKAAAVGLSKDFIALRELSKSLANKSMRQADNPIRQLLAGLKGEVRGIPNLSSVKPNLGLTEQALRSAKPHELKKLKQALTELSWRQHPIDPFKTKPKILFRGHDPWVTTGFRGGNAGGMGNRIDKLDPAAARDHFFGQIHSTPFSNIAGFYSGGVPALNNKNLGLISFWKAKPDQRYMRPTDLERAARHLQRAARLEKIPSPMYADSDAGLGLTFEYIKKRPKLAIKPQNINPSQANAMYETPADPNNFISWGLYDKERQQYAPLTKGVSELLHRVSARAV